jgi:hypothetical protein
MFCKQFNSVVTDLKIIDHENSDNNLESPYISSIIVRRSSYHTKL